MLNLLKIWRNEKSREIIVQVIVLIIFGWFMVCLLFRVEVRRVLSQPGSSHKHEQNESDAVGLNRRR